MRKEIKEASKDVETVDPVAEALAETKSISKQDPPKIKKSVEKPADDSRNYDVIYCNPQSDDFGGVTILMDVTTKRKRSPAIGHASIDLNGVSFPCFVSQVVPRNINGTALPEGTKEAERFNLKISIADTLIHSVAPHCKGIKMVRVY